MPTTSTMKPLQKFRFRVTLGSGASAGFQKVSGLSREIEVVEYNESNSNVTQKLKGRVKNPEVVLEKGACADSTLENLFTSALSGGSIGTALIELLDDTGTTARAWQLNDVWCSKWELGDLDASSSDIAIEKVTLQYSAI